MNFKVYILILLFFILLGATKSQYVLIKFYDITSSTSNCLGNLVKVISLSPSVCYPYQSSKSLKVVVVDKGTITHSYFTSSSDCSGANSQRIFNTDQCNGNYLFMLSNSSLTIEPGLIYYERYKSKSDCNNRLYSMKTMMTSGKCAITETLSNEFVYGTKGTDANGGISLIQGSVAMCTSSLTNTTDYSFACSTIGPSNAFVVPDYSQGLYNGNIIITDYRSISVGSLATSINNWNYLNIPVKYQIENDVGSFIVNDNQDLQIQNINVTNVKLSAVLVGQTYFNFVPINFVSLPIILPIYPNLDNLYYSNLLTKEFIVNFTTVGGWKGNNQVSAITPNSPNSIILCFVNYCSFKSLPQGSLVIFTLYVNNSGYSTPLAQEVQLYPPVRLSVMVSRTADLYSFSFATSGGIGSLVIDFKIIDLFTCTSLSGCSFSIPPDSTQKYVATLTSGDSSVVVTDTIYNYPNLTVPNITITDPSTNSVKVSWTPSQGGLPGATKYQVMVGNEEFKGSWRLGCLDVVDTQCEVLKLVPSTSYNIRVVATNTYFTQTSGLVTVQTLTPLPDSSACNLNKDAGICSHHGTCVQSQCLCSPGWDGAYCDIQRNNTNGNSTVIDPTPNNPTINITDTSSNGTFTFALGRLIEVGLTDETIKSLDLSLFNWTFVSSSNQSLVNPLNNQSIIETIYNYTINNRTNQQINSYALSISISFIIFKLNDQQLQNDSSSNSTIDYYPFNFAGQNITVKYGSIKYSFNIEQWRFESKLNSLKLVTNYFTQSSINNNGCDGGDDGSTQDILVTNNDSPITTISISSGNQGSIIYGRLLNRVLLDGVTTQVTHRASQQISTFNSSTTNTTIITTVPYFSDSLYVDPDLSLLVQDPSSTPRSTTVCKQNDNRWKSITIGIVVGVVGAAILTVSSIFIYSKYRRSVKLAIIKLKERDT